MSAPRVLLGHVVRAHGIRGAVRVRPTSGRAADTAASLSAARTLYLDEEPVTIARVRPDKDDLLIELAGVADRGRAEALRGRAIWVDRAALPVPDEDEVYLEDLRGCEVVAPDGAAIGRVRGSFHSGAHETLIVDGPRGEVLLPWVPAYVVAVDVAARRVVYDAPEGLIDVERAEQG